MENVITKLIVWMIVGGLAGSLVGRLVTRTREGLGLLKNLGVGMVGALVGGGIFSLIDIPWLEKITVSLEDLVAAVVGALLFVVGLWGYRQWAKKKMKTVGVSGGAS